MSKWVIREEDDNSSIEMIIAAMFISLIVAVISFIVSIFVAFIAVGVVWGTITSIKNYIVGVKESHAKLGETLSYAWNENIAAMQLFINKASTYQNVLPVLVKPFLVMSGIGTIIIGTLLLPQMAFAHILLRLLLLPFKTISDRKE